MWEGGTMAIKEICILKSSPSLKKKKNLADKSEIGIYPVVVLVR